MTSERVSLAFQQIFPTSVTKTRKFLATQAPALWSRRSVAPCDIWLSLLVSSTRAIIDDHMTVITAFGTSWFISNIPLHSSIIYHHDILKTGQAVNSDLHNTVASMCVCVSVRYVVVGAWCELSFKLNCFATRGIFLWVVCVCLYFFPFLYLSTGFFVPDFNGQKASDLIAGALLILIYMIVQLLNERLRVSVYQLRFSSPNVTDLFSIPSHPVYT